MEQYHYCIYASCRIPQGLHVSIDILRGQEKQAHDLRMCFMDKPYSYWTLSSNSCVV